MAYNQKIKQGDDAVVALIVLGKATAVAKDLTAGAIINIVATLRVDDTEVAKFSQTVKTGFGKCVGDASGNLELFVTRDMTKTFPATGRITSTVLITHTDADFPEGRTETYSYIVGTVIAADPNTLDEELP